VTIDEALQKVGDVMRVHGDDAIPMFVIHEELKRLRTELEQERQNHYLLAKATR